jgi:hypothetical protein
MARLVKRRNIIRIPFGSMLVLGTIVACTRPSPPDDADNLVNGTRTEQAAPAGALGQEQANYGEGNVTPGERPDAAAPERLKAEQVASRFATLLEQKRFADAFQFVDARALGSSEEQFERRFADYKTIDAAIGKIGRTEGAAGSLYTQVQLTLSGAKKDGTPYAITGPLTLRRVNDVPGSTAEQRQWHIEKIDLTANAAAAEKLVKH